MQSDLHTHICLSLLGLQVPTALLTASPKDGLQGGSGALECHFILKSKETFPLDLILVTKEMDRKTILFRSDNNQRTEPSCIYIYTY